MPPRTSCSYLGGIVNPRQLLYSLTSGGRQPDHNVHLLHSHINDVHKTSRQSLKARTKRNGTRAGRRLADNRNIIVTDLFATLEAHRAANSDSIVRKVYGEYDKPANIRPSLFHSSEPAYPIADPPPLIDELVRRRELLASVTSKAAVAKPEEKQAPKASAIRKYNSRRRKLFRLKTMRRACPDVSRQQDDDRPLSRRLVIQQQDGSATDSRLSKISGSQAVQKPHSNALEVTRQSPWISLLPDMEGDGLTRLEKEIEAYENYMNLEAHDMRAFELLAADVKHITKKNLPSAVLKLLGPYSMGLATPTSDVNIRLSLSEYERDPLSRGPSATRPEACKAVQKALEKLYRILQRTTSFQDVKLFPSSIWLLEAVHRPSRLLVRIQANPIQSYSVEYVKTCFSEFPTLHSLYVVLHWALRLRGLDNSSEGGIDSYQTLMMIVFALKRCESLIPLHHVASQLLYILKFYSDVDLSKYGFMLTPPLMFDKTKTGTKSFYAIDNGIGLMPKMNPEKSHLMYFQDPANPKIDLGVHSYRIGKIQRAFYSARIQILHSMRVWEDRTEDEKQSSSQSCLVHLVGANYRQFELRRKELKERMSLAKYIQQELVTSKEKPAPQKERDLAPKDAEKPAQQKEVISTPKDVEDSSSKERLLRYVDRWKF